MMTKPSALLRHFDVYPKKSLGQNFMYDPIWIDRIINASEISNSDVVLEIGPGSGSLTTALAAVARKVIAVEIDNRLMPILNHVLSGYSNVTVVCGDILEYDPYKLVAQHGVSKFVVVANIPYYITGQIMRHLLQANMVPDFITMSVQREVAERMVASPGQMSLLSVSVQFYSDVKIVDYIPAGAFYPVPAVDSALIRLDVFDSSNYIHPDTKSFFRVVRAGFGQKRKQLQNALVNGLGISRDQAIGALSNAGLDARCRAQTLTIQDWSHLTYSLSDSISVIKD
jgi:16S rRNA (adenine1518-N6/adenine1519-N6)-dimethyltransferase